MGNNGFFLKLQFISLCNDEQENQKPMHIYHTL
jgi:hypothetical protein